MPDRVGRASPGLWGGRFSAAPAPGVLEYTDSLAVDRRLFGEDIAGSVAHVEMLAAVGIIGARDARALSRGLRSVLKEMESGVFRFEPGDEDIHTAVERRLGELVGAEAAGKLHTGRSRNDQVALDLRLFARARVLELARAVTALREALLDKAAVHATDLFPAYTHLQRAQPTTIGHHLLAYVAMLERDFARLRDAYPRVDVMPLGSGAATGTGLPLDRALVARRLGFAALSSNSLDAVSDRDFVVEVEACCALLMVHLSRLGEEWVLWSTQEFGLIELPDDLATGSSLMPQKKNPDIAELARGRSARVTGDLVAILALLKGLPLAYNRDLQEDKQGFFDATDTTLATLRVVAQLVEGTRFRVEAARLAASDPAMLATEVADHLVRRGVPFRKAHGAVGRAVALAASRGVGLDRLELEDWRAIEPLFDAAGLSVLDPGRAVAARELPGGPGPKTTRHALAAARRALRRDRGWVTATTSRQG